MLGRLHARVRAWFAGILAAHTSPGALALAVYVGAVAGCMPVFGVHFVLCLGLARLLRLNAAAMYAAANISIPPLIPFIGFASVQLGERMRSGAWMHLTLDDFRHPSGEMGEVVSKSVFHWLGPSGVGPLLRRLFIDWALGALVVGSAVGIVFAAIVYPLARRRPRTGPVATGIDAQAIRTAIEAASRRFRTAPPNLRWYAFFKYRMDPCYRRIAALVPPGTRTVDLGTGLGMLPLVLALLPGEREAIGVEWDEAKREAGARAAADLGPRVQLLPGDARTVEIPPCDVVTIVDMLHYFDAATQRAILARAAAALRPGGQLLLREGDAGRAGAGSRWTRAIEALAVRIGWNRGDGDTRFRGAADLESDLRALGLRVTVEPLAGRLHPGNVLLCGQKSVPTSSNASRDNAITT